MNTNIRPTVSSDNLANTIGISFPEVCRTSINPFVVSLLICFFFIPDALSAGFSVFIDVTLVPPAGSTPNVYQNWIWVVKFNKICAGSFSVSPLEPWLYFAVPCAWMEAGFCRQCNKDRGNEASLIAWHLYSKRATKTHSSNCHVTFRQAGPFGT